MATITETLSQVYIHKTTFLETSTLQLHLAHVQLKTVGHLMMQSLYYIRYAFAKNYTSLVTHPFIHSLGTIRNIYLVDSPYLCKVSDDILVDMHGLCYPSSRSSSVVSF